MPSPVDRSPHMPWYIGPSLLDALESASPRSLPSDAPTRMHVQFAARTGPEFRGYAGTITGGALRPGAKVTNVQSRVSATVTRIVTMDGDLDRAGSGEPVMLVLDREIDV